ncbi:MAG TPA: ArsR family transcriptional regulator [Chloroflexi bacterium]|nr:ArsR family transcriptional regulator [Chloroflexota bacterium]
MMPNPVLREEINQLHAHICSGLADPIRIVILYTLAQQSRTVNELVEALGAPQPTVSRHLRHLRDRGLVEASREGQYVRYTLKDPRVIEALDILRAVMHDYLQERVNLIGNPNEVKS